VSTPMSILEIFRVFLKLGLTSFGGPVAHIGYFHQAFVRDKGWVREDQFAGWLALCQFLPGPASSQLGFLIGLYRGGFLGALAAWSAFTLPSAMALVLVATLGLNLASGDAVGVLQGLKLVAVAVVAHAIWTMSRALCQRPHTRVAALIGFGLAWGLGGWWGQIGALIAGAILGLVIGQRLGLARSVAHESKPVDTCHVSGRLGVMLIALAFVLLVAPSLLITLGITHPGLTTFDAFYRSGALVFGGGHVVLPLLESAVVAPGWVSEEAFLTGYGLAQAVPGPLFTFAAWLGVLNNTLSGPMGAALALVAVFLAGLLLVTGALPWWQRLQEIRWAIAVFAGINAAVVGVLAAAWVNPILTTSIRGWVDALIALAMIWWLVKGKAAPWAVVLACVVLTWGAQQLGWVV